MEQEHEEQKEERKIKSIKRFLAFGILGYLSGRVVKKVGKFTLISVGGTMLALELLGDGYSYGGYSTIARVGSDLLRIASDVARNLATSLNLQIYEYLGFIGGVATAFLF